MKEGVRRRGLERGEGERGREGRKRRKEGERQGHVNTKDSIMKSKYGTDNAMRASQGPLNCAECRTISTAVPSSLPLAFP